MKRKNRMLRIDEETREKLRVTSKKLSMIEKKDVSMGEVVKRSFNIPDLYGVLEQDSQYKRRFKRI